MVPATGDETKSPSLPWEQHCHRFSLDEIRSATRNFDRVLVIGQGGFGKVYKGHINNGASTSVAAIKRLDSRSNQGAPEFWAEIEMLSKRRHCHLVSLIGYCNDGEEMILVYEYMPHGTLEDLLHKVGTPLSWLQRLKICIGAARGLDYLHTGTGTHHGVIHRDVKSSNILLDENWAAKISDFGLSKIGPINQTRTHVSTRVKGTFGYLDPDYFSTCRLTRKSDVYAFGVVLFEVLCRRHAVDTSLDTEQWGLARWAQDCIEEKKLDQIVDSGLRGQILPKCLKEFAQIARRCLHSHPKQRPTMTEIVARLEFVLSRQERTDNSIRPASIMVFTRKVQKFFFASIGVNSDHLDAKPSGTSSGQTASQQLKIFTYNELASATMNFKGTEYGAGCFASVYTGWVDERTYAPTDVGVGMAITIRHFDVDLDGKLDPKILGEFNHPNLVKVLGYCLEDKHQLCVYEFMQNGSLVKHLFKSTETLPWVRRLKIAVGAARGLAFLHTRKQISYSQFKTSFILLDGDFNAKLSVFKLATSGPSFSSYLFSMDAFYAAPEWYAYQVAMLDEGRDGYHGALGYNNVYFSVKSEVYAFGVVLLEILTGQQVYDPTRPEGKQNLVKWAMPLLSDEKNLQIFMDPQLKQHYPPEGAFQVALLVLKCLQPIEENRPSMEEVLRALVYQCHQDETK